METTDAPVSPYVDPSLAAHSVEAAVHHVDILSSSSTGESIPVRLASHEASDRSASDAGRMILPDMVGRPEHIPEPAESAPTPGKVELPTDTESLKEAVENLRQEIKDLREQNNHNQAQLAEVLSKLELAIDSRTDFDATASAGRRKGSRPGSGTPGSGSKDPGLSGKPGSGGSGDGKGGGPGKGEGSADDEEDPKTPPTAAELAAKAARLRTAKAEAQAAEIEAKAQLAAAKARAEAAEHDLAAKAHSGESTAKAQTAEALAKAQLAEALAKAKAAEEALKAPDIEAAKIAKEEADMLKTEAIEREIMLAEEELGQHRDNLVEITIRRKARMKFTERLRRRGKNDITDYEAAQDLHDAALKRVLKARLAQKKWEEPKLSKEEQAKFITTEAYGEERNLVDEEVRINNEQLDKLGLRGKFLRKYAKMSKKKKFALGVGIGGLTALTAGGLGIGVAGALAIGLPARFSLGLMNRKASIRNATEHGQKRSHERIQREMFHALRDLQSRRLKNIRDIEILTGERVRSVRTFYDGERQNAQRRQFIGAAIMGISLGAGLVFPLAEIGGAIGHSVGHAAEGLAHDTGIDLHAHTPHINAESFDSHTPNIEGHPVSHYIHELEVDVKRWFHGTPNHATAAHSRGGASGLHGSGGHSTGGGLIPGHGTGGGNLPGHSTGGGSVLESGAVVPGDQHGVLPGVLSSVAEAHGGHVIDGLGDNFHPDTFYGNNQEQVIRGMFGVMARNGIQVHGVDAVRLHDIAQDLAARHLDIIEGINADGSKHIIDFASSVQNAAPEWSGAHGLTDQDSWQQVMDVARARGVEFTRS